ncbi:MAG: endo-1,4-beta-xylanase [Fimbriimonadaceae bacterium]|nr:endo-1,4-beta-xylanase [Fimbriimonadaceae bacterium]
MLPLTFALALSVTTEAESAPATVLREAFKDRFLIGTALTASQLSDPASVALITSQFNVITPGNEMKPASLLVAPGRYDFRDADRFVDFAEKHGLEIIGHTLVWHSQSRAFLFEDEAGRPLPRETALRNMRDHIMTVVGRYRGRIKGWDVVNEAVADSGGLRETPALKAIGPDYVEKAFRFAAEADPEAELYYNDYNIDLDYKRESGLKLVRDLRAAGVRLDAVGIQGHYLLGTSIEEVQRGIQAYIDDGFEVMITELDIDPLPRRGAGGADVTAEEREGMDPYRNGLPAAVQAELADRYGRLFDYFVTQPKITRVTFWGLTDGDSWLNYFPVRSRTNHPLLFDRSFQPKPAFFRVLESAKKIRARQ